MLFEFKFPFQMLRFQSNIQILILLILGKTNLRRFTTLTKTIGIIQINDTHANLLPKGNIRYSAKGFKVENLGGYARIMTKVKEYRKKLSGKTLLFDNGDTFHGTYEAVQSKGEVMIPYLNILGVDGMTFHWDVAYTPKHLIELGTKLNFPILAANVYDDETDELLFPPVKTYEIDGIKIGVIGVASNIIKKNMPAQFWEGAEFTNGIDESRYWAKRLRDDGVNLVILLSHLGYPQDIELLKQVDGIDICLSGHTHNRIRFLEKVRNSYIIQSGSLASSMGFLELDFVDGEMKNTRHEYTVLDNLVQEDNEIIEMLNHDKILNSYSAHLDEIVGESKIDLHRGSSFFGTMDYLLLDSIRDATGLDIAFSNGWRYGGAVAAGALTKRHLYQIVPMDPEIITAELTGYEIFHLLEDNLESTFSTDPFKQMGGYIKRDSGLKIYFKLENPYGYRIQRIFVNDEELDFEKIYKVAYVTRQAVPETYGKNHIPTGIYSIGAMENYLKKAPYDRADLESYIPV